jgi:polysaccharide pyruvyl transferase WcaK-like protein
MSRKSSRPVAFMSVKTQFDNLGDVLINRELALALANRAETYIDFSRCPSSFRAAMNVEAHPNIRSLVRLGSVRLLYTVISKRLSGRPCFYFLNPGGLGGKELTAKQSLTASAYNIVLLALKRIGVKNCIVGVSYDRLMKRNRWVTAVRHAAMHVVAVRDNLSVANLKRDGVRVDQVVPDLSFLSFSGKHIAPNRSAIAFSFRFDKSDADAIESFVLQTAEKHQARRLKFVAQVARDAKPMHAIAERVAATGLVVESVDGWASFDITNDAYHDTAVVYSNRLHALLMAAYVGATPIAVVAPHANEKIVGLFSDLGLSRLIHYLGESIPEGVAATEPLEGGVIEVERQKVEDFFDRLIRSASVGRT